MSIRELESLIRAGSFADAIALANERLGKDPADRESLYARVVAARFDSQFSEARKYAQELVDHHADYGRGWQEFGHTLRSLTEVPEALAAYRRATNANPALKASWQALAELSSDADEARQAREEVAYLSAMPSELLIVVNMLYEGRLQEAETLCRRFMQVNTRHTEGMRLLADIATRLHVYDDAETLLLSALTLHPDFHLARLDYINVLQRRQKFPQAMVEAEKLLAVDPGNRFFRMVAASQLSSLGQFDRAIAIFDSLIQEGKDTALTHLLRAHALKTIGRQAEAVAAYHNAASKRPNFGDAYWSLANLKTYRFDADEMRHMQQSIDARDIATEDRFHFAFALGKAHEDRGEYEESFRSYALGNELKRSTLGYKPEQLEEEVAALKSAVTAELLTEKAKTGCPDPAPIFIVGLPRAGSTLIEQILASHSQVDGTLELPYIPAAVHRLRGPAAAYPQCLRDIAGADVSAIGNRYLDECRVFRGSAPRFIDKMPNNFRNIGLIAMALPNAVIIDARRDAMDCSFSCFKQLFSEGQEFTYGLEYIARYYRAYVDLMEYWDRIMPGRILRVQHEDVVANLEPQVRRIMNHCGLEFEAACLEYYRSDRAVRTASSEQVRQPINSRGIGQWKRFAPWLEPLRTALGDLAKG